MIYQVRIPCVNYDRTGVDFQEFFFEKDGVITKEDVITYLNELHSEEMSEKYKSFYIKSFYNNEWLEMINKVKECKIWPEEPHISLTSSPVEVNGFGEYSLNVFKVDLIKV